VVADLPGSGITGRFSGEWFCMEILASVLSRVIFDSEDVESTPSPPAPQGGEGGVSLNLPDEGVTPERIGRSFLKHPLCEQH
jgi:hypothetical protein